MFDTAKATVLLVLAVGLAALAWWLVAERTPAISEVALVTPTAEATTEEGVEDVEDAQAAAKREAKAAALALIAAESDAAPPPLIEAPPNFEPAPASRHGARSPQPPAGFTFTAYHGAMAKGRMTEADYTTSDDASAPAELAGFDSIGALAQQAKAASRAWTFGWVGMTPAAELTVLSERLQALGAEVLGRSGDLLRMRLPGDAARLRQIAALDGVAQVAATPAKRKTAAAFLVHAAAHPLDETPVFVTLMDDDADGRWRQELRRLGATVGRFDPAVRIYVASVPHAALADILAADFVQAVEPMGRVAATHDVIVPAMGADALRLYDDSSGLFSGNAGGDVAIGVMDTGLNINHVDISSNRRSICGGNFVPGQYTAGRFEDQDLWIDIVGHGTHVTGTIAGNGSANPVFAGMAPLVPDIRFAKVLGSANPTTDAALGRGMDFLAKASSCGPNPVAAKPLLVNVSLGYSDADWEGRSVAERKLDATVWSHRQLYVVAAGNAGFSARGDLASAKNALTVGATEVGGDIASFSSHGPTLDGRLKPQIVGTGVGVVSAAGSGARQSYAQSSGTSMSSPAVAGVAALLMNAVPNFREQPALVRARLMASAIKPDAFLEDARMFPPHNGNGPGTLQNIYGLGKVSARTSVLNRDQDDGWISGSASVELEDGEYGYHDIEVPVGATRLDVAMTWDEPPADTLAQTLLNDLDLWVDAGADCPAAVAAACGNAASRSTVDNVEWLIVRNPAPGVHRLKVVPKRARTQTPRAALAWTVIRGPSTPQLAIAADTDAIAAAPGSPFEIEVSLSADGYVAAGTILRIDCRSEADANACQRTEYIAKRASSARREDGVVRSLGRTSSDRIALGELAAGEEQTVRLVFPRLPNADRFRLYFTATAWNAGSASTSVDVSIGNAEIAPSPPVALPANDDFAAAAQLRGDSGQLDFDLLLATPQPGEPPFTRGTTDDRFLGFGRPQPAIRPRSIWYAWTAPDNDTYRFSIAPSAFADFADNVQFDLFEVDAADALVSLASERSKIGGGLTFAARRGQAYRIRLSVTDQASAPSTQTPSGGLASASGRHLAMPLTLAWSKASLPSNDDFGLAAAINGTHGAVESSNFGATLQRSEFFHPLAGTIWYRWQAPASGDWRFSVNRRHLRVAAFVGDDIDGLRLVSGAPDRHIVFPVQAGMEYRLLVAAADAGASGSEFTLAWEPGERPDGNDDMANARELAALPSSSQTDIQNFSIHTVEPGEPVASGSRTAWWSWTAPADGTYTWRADAGGAPLRLTVFAVDADGAPTLLARSGSATKTEMELSFAALAEQRYLIAAGLASDAAFTALNARNIVFRWGSTPANDNLANAELLSGNDGSLAGNNRFATLEAGENTAALGDSSLWWVWQAAEDGWQRFTLDDDLGNSKLTIYRMTGSGFAQLELVATSRRLASSTNAIFQAQAGERYVVRLGTDIADYGDRFGLSWSADEPPAWLRFAAATLDGDLDAAGNLLQVANPVSLVFGSDGHALYAATLNGLQVYRRDADSGALRFEQQLDGADLNTKLLWDSSTSSLVVASCDGWRKFVPMEGGVGLRAMGALQGTIGCPERLTFTDSTGTFVHLVSSAGVAVWRLDDERTRIEEASFTPAMGATAATLDADDQFVYVATAEGLNTYERDLTTGALSLVHQVTETDTLDSYAGSLRQVGTLAVDAAGEHLFAFGDGGVTPFAFSLTNRAEPQFLVSMSSFTQSFNALNPFAVPQATLCRFSSARAQTLSVDVVCGDSLFSVRLLGDPPQLRAEDNLVAGTEDLFDNPLPFFDTSAGGAATSPDGRHIYVATGNAILVFERIGSR